MPNQWSRERMPGRRTRVVLPAWEHHDQSSLSGSQSSRTSAATAALGVAMGGAAITDDRSADENAQYSTLEAARKAAAGLGALRTFYGCCSNTVEFASLLKILLVDTYIPYAVCWCTCARHVGARYTQKQINTGTLLRDDAAHLAHLEAIAAAFQVSHCDVDDIGPGGATPLLLACIRGDRADVEALLAVGANPTAEGDVWDAPIYSDQDGSVVVEAVK